MCAICWTVCPQYAHLMHACMQVKKKGNADFLLQYLATFTGDLPTQEEVQAYLNSYHCLLPSHIVLLELLYQVVSPLPCADSAFGDEFGEGFEPTLHIELPTAGHMDWSFTRCVYTHASIGMKSNNYIPSLVPSGMEPYGSWASKGPSFLLR